MQGNLADVRGDPIIAESARKHGVGDSDILHTFANPIRVFELDEGFTMIVGANQAAIIYEIGVVDGHRPRDESPRKILEVSDMPRSVEDILEHADELARRFEDYEPASADERDPTTFIELRRAVAARSDAERSVRDAVADAREHGHSWAFIGSLIGTSGEAARQRYGRKQHT